MRTDGSWKKHRTRRHGLLPACGACPGAAIGALLWLLVLRVVQSRGRSAPILTVVVTTVTAVLALLLLESGEYGARIFPPLWGTLAILPPAAGILAAVLLRRGSGRAVIRLA